MPTYMTFVEILPMLNAGGKYSRRKWKNQKYLMRENRTFFIVDKNGKRPLYSLNIDVNHPDWHVYLGDF